MSRQVLLGCFFLFFRASSAFAVLPPDFFYSGNSPTAYLTLFLCYNRLQTPVEINARLERSGFSRQFPPAGTHIVCWYVQRGRGQAITLEVPPERVRAVKRAIERYGWGAFQTEFHFP